MARFRPPPLTDEDLAGIVSASLDPAPATGDPEDVPSSPDSTSDPVPVQPPEDAGPVVAAATSDDRFVLGTWNGITQWNCTSCRWDTVISLDAFNAHWQAHRPPPPPRPVSGLVGLDGRPLTSEV